MFKQSIVNQLDNDLSSGHVSSRKQAGRDLSYIESWFAQAEANRIFGFGNWNSETVDLKCVSEHADEQEDKGKGAWWKHYVTYVAKVRITVTHEDGGTTVREGCGAGHGKGMSDGGDAHESALKEAESDAMKRAFKSFGNPFGLALYDKTQANVVDPERRQKFLDYCGRYSNSTVVATLARSSYDTLDDVPQRAWKPFSADLATVEGVANGGEGTP